MNISKRKKVVILFILAIILIGIACLYGFRNVILSRIADKYVSHYEQTYGLQIHYKQLRMSGCNEITMKELTIVPLHSDTLVAMQTANVTVNFWKMLSRDIELRNIDIDKLAITLVKRDSVANYDFLFAKRKSQSNNESDRNGDFAPRIDRILNLLYNVLPEKGRMTNFMISERRNNNFVAMNIPSLLIDNGRFTAMAHVNEDTLSQQWQVAGELGADDRQLKVEMRADGKKKISIPYIKRRFGAEVSFDTFLFSLAREKASTKQFQLKGEASVSGLDIYHKALSPDVIHLDHGKLDYRINIDKHSVELDSTSTAQFNKMLLHPYLKVGKMNKVWQVTAALDKSWFPADDFFSSLPKGLFSNLDGIKTSGELAYHFLLDIDFSRLDSLVFESELKEKNFKILKYGATSLAKMNGEFSYTAYENGRPIRSFPIGTSWKGFTPLDSISPILRMSVMQSEDGAFFYHRGFLPDAMREALIYDLQVKRFARGGSTITMQLVKNVFLNRNKNFARKLEEALIVWLIETERLTSKERMYEVYLNIAEWGPNVYGIKEASSFYFDKRPSQLSIEESIFLASIIPKPKRYRSSFTSDGKLRESMEGYYRLIAERLAKKGLINEMQMNAIKPEIRVTERALHSSEGKSEETDSIIVDEP